MSASFFGFFRTLSAAFIAAFFAMSFCRAEQSDRPWQGEVQVNSIAYIPLENIRSFYKLTPVSTTSGSREFAVGNAGICLAFRRQSCEASLGGYRCRLSHPTAEDARGELLISKTDTVKLLDPLLRPAYIAPRRVVRSVVIDPGHGGHDVGIIANQVREADLTLLLARKLRELLVQRGLNVILTRDQNQAVSDRQRVDTLAHADAPIFISLHLNKGRSDTGGIETYTLQPAEPSVATLPGNESDEANVALGFCLQSSLVAATGAADGGLRRVRFNLLSSVPCPAALVLPGYATNEEEAAAMNTAEYQDKLAHALAEGIAAFVKALNPDTKTPVSTAPVDTTPPTPYKADVPTQSKNTATGKQRTGKQTSGKQTSGKQGATGKTRGRGRRK